MGPSVEDIPSEVTQNDESFLERPTKKRIDARSAEKRKVKLTATEENNDDRDPERGKSRNRCESDVNGSFRNRQTKTILVTRLVERRRAKASETVKGSSANRERGNLRCQSALEKDAEPRKRHGSRKRGAPPTATSLLIQSEKKPQQLGFSPSPPKPVTNERPRRNLPKVSYVYPVQEDADVQTRDKLFVPSSKATK
ncbi:hypothetical protein FGB62_64g024 [Gracilaria domingensis]|nr:hypothetical protein FGB62_64g024 [Gracilaria domingensis]